MKATYRDGDDQPREVRVEAAEEGGVRVSVGELDTEVTCEPLGHGCFRLRAGDRSWRVWVDRDGATRHVTMEGVGQAVLEREGRGRRRRRETPEGSLSSPMPGTVVKVLVAEGDVVEKGQDLVIVEAMKMEIKVSAPAAGTVRSVRGVEGEPCDAGETLVEIMTADADAADAAS